MKKNRFALLAFAAVIFCGCEQLQSTLSSEMKKTLTEETGTAVIDSDTWYYNGSEKTDVSSYSASLKISFTRKVKVSEDGIKAAFEIQYFDADGNSTLVTKSSSAGTMSADGMSYNLDMSNALSLIDAETTQGNTVTATVKISGFVCAEGEQAGRALSAITKTISVAPLFEEKVLGSIEFASAENVFEIPLLGAVQIEGTPSVESEEFPEGVTADSFNVSLSDDGTKIILEPKVSLGENEFNAILKVFVRPLICGAAYEKEFNLSFVSGTVTCTDTMEFVSGDSNGWAKDCDITSMKAKNDSENLYVTIEFAAVPFTWKSNPRASILIGKADASASEDTSSLVGSWTGAGISTTATLNNGTIIKFFSQGEGIDTGAADGITSSVTWSGADSTGYVPSSNIFKYTIPLSAVGSAGEKINIVSFFSGNVWNNNGTDTGLTVINAVPASCVTVDAYSTVVDMSKALEYTIQ